MINQQIVLRFMAGNLCNNVIHFLISVPKEVYVICWFPIYRVNHPTGNLRIQSRFFPVILAYL